MTVQRILDSQKNVVPGHITPDAKIKDVLNSLTFKDVGALIVSSDGIKVEGIISERDIVRALQLEGEGLLNKQVREQMTKEVITCVPGDRAASIMATMVAEHLRHVPVVMDGKFLGIVGIRDLLQLRLDEVRSEAEAMRIYITG